LPVSDRLDHSAYSSFRTASSRVTVDANSRFASVPGSDGRASEKSSVLMPLRHRRGIRAIYENIETVLARGIRPTTATALPARLQISVIRCDGFETDRRIRLVDQIGFDRTTFLQAVSEESFF